MRRIIQSGTSGLWTVIARTRYIIFRYLRSTHLFLHFSQPLLLTLKLYR